jgi:hypothetical protein
MIRKILKEKQDDWFLNLHKVWYFFRAFEYSAIELAKITDYKLFPNIDTKSGFVFLEVWFPQTRLEYVIRLIENNKINYRILQNGIAQDETIAWVTITKNSTRLIETKKELIALE